MRSKNLLTSAATALSAAAVLVALSGCTGDEADTSTTTPTPTSSATGIEKPTGECIDGIATFVDDDTEYELPDGCETVDIIGSGNTITLGEVGHLILESNDNTVDVDAVEKVTNLSFGNTVSHGGDAPEVDTGADDVEVSAR